MIHQPYRERFRGADRYADRAHQRLVAASAGMIQSPFAHGTSQARCRTIAGKPGAAPGVRDVGHLHGVHADTGGLTLTRGQWVQFGVGSRVLVEGHQAWPATISLERLARADGMGNILVPVPRNELVLVIDTIFNADPPLPAAEAQRQPAQVWWLEFS
jgi:hypothetical protein